MQINNCNCGGEGELLTTGNEVANHLNPDVVELFYLECISCGTQTKDCRTPEEAQKAWHKVMHGNKLSADLRKVLEAVVNSYKTVSKVLSDNPNYIECVFCHTWGKDKNDMHHSAQCPVLTAEKLLKGAE